MFQSVQPAVATTYTLCFRVVVEQTFGIVPCMFRLINHRNAIHMMYVHFFVYGCGEQCSYCFISCYGSKYFFIVNTTLLCMSPRDYMSFIFSTVPFWLNFVLNAHQFVKIFLLIGLGTRINVLFSVNVSYSFLIVVSYASVSSHSRIWLVIWRVRFSTFSVWCIFHCLPFRPVFKFLERPCFRHCSLCSWWSSSADPFSCEYSSFSSLYFSSS